MNLFGEIVKYLNIRNNFLNIRLLRLGFYLIICFLFSGCWLFKETQETSEGPNLIDYVNKVHWELVKGEVQCLSGAAPLSSCLVPLELVFDWQSGFEDHRGYSCCLDCERGVPAGQIGLTTIEFATGNSPLSPRVRIPGHKPRPGMIIWTRAAGIHENVNRDWCDDFRSSDLEGSNLQALINFLNQLTNRYGESYNLNPDSNNPKDVCLYISNADPPIRTDPDGNTGTVAGEISCASGSAARARNCRYQVTLYKQAFYGQCAIGPYNIVAHEFKHILQSIELNLPTGSCDQPGNSGNYEQEARNFAKSIVSDCANCL